MQSANLSWHEVCNEDEIEEEDLIQFEHAGKVYAVYHTASGYYATDGLCTHETAHLAKGFVLGEMIECPRHQGRFHIPTGQAKGAPACVDLRTHPTKIESGYVFIGLADGS
jgi:3-phenylpropionate/trans-cinnamate dioxygenase ferredoxin component